MIDLDGERSAEQRADDEAVDGRRSDRRARLERVAPDDRARAGRRARSAAAHERLADHLAHRLRLQPLEHRGQRQRQRQQPARPGGAAGRQAAVRDVAERMPPIGSQPVRAATKTRKSDVSSGGIDSRTTRRAPGSRPRARPPRPAAGDDAERQADERGDEQRREREDRRVGGALGNEIGDRPVVGSDRPKSKRTAPASQAPVLLADRIDRGRSARAPASIVSRPRRRCRASRSAKSPGASRVSTSDADDTANTRNDARTRSRRSEVRPATRPHRRPSSPACQPSERDGIVSATTAAAAARRPASGSPRAPTRRRRCAGADEVDRPAGARRRSSAPRRTAACAPPRRARRIWRRISSSIRAPTPWPASSARGSRRARCPS